MLYLVGNKIDSTEERVISFEEGIQKSKEFNVSFQEVSAKTGDNIQNLFKLLK